MKKEKPFILHALSPTKIVSPFDINMAYDSGFDNVATYTNITMEDVPDLVQDIVFSRHPNDCKKTGLFIAGENAEEAIEMLEKAKKAMVPPFEISVFADPAGSFTTAGAMIACVKNTLESYRSKYWNLQACKCLFTHAFMFLTANFVQNYANNPRITMKLCKS